MSTHPRTGRGFGGQVGVILFKRRMKSSAASTGKLGSSPPSGQHNERGGGRTSNVTLIGWDDVLCRPIYSFATTAPRPRPAAPEAPSSHVTSSEDDNEEGEDDGDDDDNDGFNSDSRWKSHRGSVSTFASTQHVAKMTNESALHLAAASCPRTWIDPTNDEGRQTAGAPPRAVSWYSRQKNKRLRAYTTTKSKLRVLGLSTKSEDSSAVNSSSNLDKDRESKPPAECRREEASGNASHTDIWAPAQPPARVLSAADSVADDLCFADDASKGRRETCQKRKKRRKVARVTSESTPLRAARKYFQDLDSHHPLRLEHSSTASSSINDYDGGACTHREKNGWVDGRSVRPILETNPIVMREYESHHQSCQEAGVSPLQWKHFLRQRQLHHATMYEGMLDD